MSRYGVVIVPPVTSELFSILENRLIGYADDYTLMAVVPSPGVRVAVAESLIRDLVRVSEWCDLCGIIIIIKKDWQCLAGKGRLTPYQSEDDSPTLPTYRGKEEKGKILEDKKGEQLGQLKGIEPALETRQSHTIKYGVNQIVPERY